MPGARPLSGLASKRPLAKKTKSPRRHHAPPLAERLEARYLLATIPVTVTIPRVRQIDNPDCIEVLGVKVCPDDGDYYAKVTINGVQQTVNNEITDDDFRPPDWIFTQNVDSSIGNVPIHIELWDEDDALRFNDNEMDISPVSGHLGLDLSVNLTTGAWTGDVPFPSLSATGNGDGEGNAELFFFIDFGNNLDTDGDGLPNTWEARGIDADNNGSIDFKLPGDPNPYHKDLYVEVDAMTGLAPTAATLQRVADAFAAAPNSLVNNPDGKDGITLHNQLDETNIPVASWTALDANGWPIGFDTIKTNTNPSVAGGFGTTAERGAGNATALLAAKRLAYRYAIFGQQWGTTTSSGMGELPGNDFMVTMGTWSTPGGTPNQQAGTYMHELGHTLGLGHGGALGARTGTLTNGSMVVTGIDTSQLFAGQNAGVSGIGIPFNTNIASIDSATQITLSQAVTAGGTQTLFFRDDTPYKPNYHSVMNYTWQLPWTPTMTSTAQTNFQNTWGLVYSERAFPDLNENAGLDEGAGIGGHPGHTLGIVPQFSSNVLVGYQQYVGETGAVNWNNTGSNTETGVTQNINNFVDSKGNAILETLRGAEDWSRLVYSFRNSSDFADGIHASSEPNEITNLDANVASGVLFFQTSAGANDLTLRLLGGNLEIVNNANGAVVASRPAASTWAVWVQGVEGVNDLLTVSFTGGNPIPSSGLRFDGAGGTDRLAFAGTLPANPVYTPNGDGDPADGKLNLGSSLITFTDLEFVASVAPDITGARLNATTIDENGSVTLTGEFLDPGSLSSHTLQLNWGDGTTETVNLTVGARSISRTHQYLDDNPTNTASDVYSVTVKIIDNDNLSDTAGTSITVNNVAPVMTSLTTNASSSTPGQEGQPITISGAFTDVGTLDTHTVNVEWFDGTNSAATVTESSGSGTFSAQHAFTSGGIYTITARLRDDDTGQAVRTKTLFITGVGVQTFNFNGVATKTLVVVGSAGNDNVTITQQSPSQFLIYASFLSENPRTINVSGIQLIEVVLLGGNDQLAVAGNITLPSVLDGGSGKDTIYAGSGTNIVIGGPDDDVLVGAAARDIVIGGLGSDRLVGNGGDDILISGRTSYDSGADDDKLANDAILLKLLGEWTSSRTYNQRVTNIRTGVALPSGTALLALGSTVFNDTAIDWLTGSAGQDWFLYDKVRDVLTDLARTETTN